EDIPAPDVEAAGGTEHEAEPRPCQAVVEERPQEVEVLVGEERPPLDGPLAARRSHGASGVESDPELARHPHDPAGILDDEAHALEQRVALEDHVRVDSADEAVASGVEARVHRIS